MRRKFKAAERGVHGLWQILKALVSTDHPLLADWAAVLDKFRTGGKQIVVRAGCVLK